MSQTSHRSADRTEFLLGGLLAVAFLFPLLLNGPAEHEVVWATLAPNQFHFRALLRGEWLYWFNDLGFGTPMPVSDTLRFHPVFGLFAGWAPLRVVLTATWLFHAVVAAVYVQRLARLSGASLPLRLLVLGCYLWSAPSLLYFYGSDWVQHAIAWFTFPVLVWYLHQAVTGDARARFVRTALLLGVLFGLWVINSHPGYVVPLLVSLTIYALVLLDRQWPRTLACLAVAGLLCVAIASERVYFLWTEALGYPPGLPRSASALHYGLQDYLTSLVLTSRADRMPFVGLVPTVAALGALGMAAKDGFRNRTVTAAAVTFVLSALLGALRPPFATWLAPSGPWFFRDPLTLFGLLAAAAALQRLWQHGLRAVAVVGVAAALAMAAQATLVARHALETYTSTLRTSTFGFYRNQGARTGAGLWFAQVGEAHGRRVYLAPEAEAAMRKELSASGIYASSDLVFLGLNPVNGWFKNISMDRLYPSTSLMESIIRADRSAIDNAGLLDVLGINAVITLEPGDAPPAGLRMATEIQTASGRTLRAYVNDHAWRLATLMEPSAAGVRLGRVPSCPHQGALCGDYGRFSTGRRPEPVDVVASGHGRYVARVPPAPTARLLFLSVLHRPEWEATGDSGQALHVVRVAHAFVGVEVPPGTTEVTLAYQPTALRRWTWFSTSALLLSLAGLLVAAARRRADTPA